MGCDIHMAIEKKVKNKWIMVTRVYWNHHSAERNYTRFAALADVLGEGPAPKGIPDDISDGAKLFIDDYGSDGHSHSWLDLGEAAKIFSETDSKESTEYEEKYPVSYYFDIEEKTCTCCGRLLEENYRLIFFFDN